MEAFGQTESTGGESMLFDVIRAVPEDVAALAEIMELVALGMEHREWFVQDDGAYIAEHIGDTPISDTDKGFILKAVTKDRQGREQLAGFFMVDFPGLMEKNLGHYIGLGQEDLLRVAHMDSVAILAEYRGYGLQLQFIRKAEEILQAETEYRILMATVHPDNIYSLRNVKQLGYEVAAEADMYGGYRRYIMKKEI